MLSAALIVIFVAAEAKSGNAVVPGVLELDPPTLVCLGIAWPVSGDENGNASVTCEYRRKGDRKWRRGPDLFRTSATLFAGSVIGLEAAAEYELRLRLADPDGGGTERRLPAATRGELKWSGEGRTWHVVPGAGGGTGTEADPFRGLAEADRAASPGDLVLVHQGVYPGTFSPRTAGEPGRPVAWRGGFDGEAILDGSAGGSKRPGRALSASDTHDLIFEDLVLRNGDCLAVFHRSQRIAMRRCRLSGCDYGIVAVDQGGGRRVTDFDVCDNVIEGPSVWPRSKGIEDARGIQISGSGHAVCYNRVRGFADGIDTFHTSPCVSIDFYGNEISEMTDDGIEMDYSDRNTRCFGNRLTNVFQGISLQPVYGGPVYVLRNAMYNVGLEVFKLHNSPSGGIMIHNTAVKKGMPLILWTSEPVFRCVSRNNLFIGSEGGYAYETTAPMRECDFDYDGFGGGPWELFLKWNEVRYATLDEVSRTAPVERNAVGLAPATCFASGVGIPADTARKYPVEVNDLRLKFGSGAVDRGTALPGFNDSATGGGPDLGAYELGSPLPHYGPRR